MNQTELNQRSRDLLDRIRHRSKVLSLFDMPSDLAEAAVWEIGRIVLGPMQLSFANLNGYRWYLREVSKLLRTKTGWDLALELEICLRKWAAYNLDPELLQALFCECYDHIAVMTPDQIEIGQESTTKTQRHQEDFGESRNQRSETRMQKCGSGAELTTKTPRHQEDSELGIGSLESSNPGVLRTVNEERCTMNEVAAVGGGDE